MLIKPKFKPPVNGDDIKLFLAEKIDAEYFIIGFSDETVKDFTDLSEIKRVFVSKYIEAKKELKQYRRDNSGESGDWGYTGLYRNVEYYSFLAEQCHYLLNHEGEDALVFWREKSRYMNFTKFDFKGNGGYYKEYLPVERKIVDGIEVIFDPNDIAEKAKAAGVVYQTVEDMLAFATAGDLAYGV